MSERFEERADLCPSCGGELLPLVFGYPSPEMMKAANRGEIALGGCVLPEDPPLYECSACDSRFYERDLTFTVP